MRVALLHALPLDASMWDNAADLGFDSPVAPTLYGLGTTIQDWAAGVVNLMGSDPFVVVGNSVGGSCALEVAARVPDQVHAIVLIGAKAGHRPEPEFRDEAIRVLRDDGIVAAWSRYWRPLFGRNASPAVVERAHATAGALDVEDLIGGVDAFHRRRDLSAFARGWTKPLVVVSGDQDPAPPPAAAAELAAMAPLGEFHEVSDSGHYVSLEQPARLAAILRRVLPARADTVNAEPVEHRGASPT